MALDFSRLPPEDPGPDKPPSRFVWTAVFFAVTVAGVFAVLLLGFCVIVVPVGTAVFVVSRRYSVYYGRCLDARANNEACNRYREEMFAYESIPVALLGSAMRVCGDDEPGGVEQIRDGTLTLSSQASNHGENPSIAARWRTPQEARLARDDAKRHAIVLQWLFDQLLESRSPTRPSGDAQPARCIREGDAGPACNRDVRTEKRSLHSGARATHSGWLTASVACQRMRNRNVNTTTTTGFFKRPWRHLLAVLLLLSVTACGKSVPVYSGISLMYQNYLPFNLLSFTITDAYGNKASGGADSPPGGGGGRLSCCYKLKGTEFTVNWDYYDVDRFLRGDHKILHAETKVSMPASPVPKDAGMGIFEVHFFPDWHVEFQFPGGLLDESRIPVVEVSRWMSDHFQERLDKRYDDNWAESHRRISRVVAAAWLKYHLTDQADLQQYAYFDLLVNDRFDAHPDVQRILQTTRSQPGAFAKAMHALPATVMSELKSDHFTAVPVPPIKDGLLPPPRVEETPHA